jgi:TorA maturation chaperone TorD
MQLSPITHKTSLFLRFYSRCFLYPYEEMGYEFQYQFRQLERGEIIEEEIPHLEQVLNIINNYQGEEIKNLRENYVSLFTQWEGHLPDCPLLASNFGEVFGITYNSTPFIDDLLISGIPVNQEEDMDSIVNYLEYFSVFCEGDLEPLSKEELSKFQNKHIFSWIPMFCDVLYQTSQINFYKEVAIGLKNYLIQINAT